MKLALDTNAYSRLDGSGNARLEQLVRQANQIMLPFVVLAELQAGFASGILPKSNQRRLERFLNSWRVEVLYADEQTTNGYAQLYAQLRRSGTPIPTNDLWIAALALQHGCNLATQDKHFQHLPQLVLV